MATSPQASLNPARGDDRWAVLGALELVASGCVDFVEVGRAEVGQGVAIEPIDCPEEGHGFFNPANLADYYGRLERFLDKSLQSSR